MVADVPIVVIGGGPAGSTAATMLARAGWPVRLFERARFPREHIGESLLPASLPILKDLGVLDAVAAEGFLPKWGATMVWGESQAPWSWYFAETNRTYPHAYQVWRPRFDQILLENSRRHGVEVREGTRVLEVLFGEGGASGVRMTDDAGAERVERAAFVVDASGQEGVLGRALRLRRPDPSFRNLAVYGYFAGAGRLPDRDENNILVESYPEGWMWNIPLHTGWMSVGAVVDSARGRDGVARSGAEGYLREQIAAAPHTRALLKGATLAAGPRVLRDWSYWSDEIAGARHVIAGDAACFIDPLFSSGVHLALSAGVLSAAYVTTALRNPGFREAAGHAYRDLYHQQYSHFREMARLFYASNRTVEGYFWEARRILDSGDALTPRQAFIRAVAGQPPVGYERAVLAHGKLPDSVASEVAGEEAALREREAVFARLAGDGGTALLARRPRLADGFVVEQRAVLGDGEFIPGAMLSGPSRPGGVALSGFVAAMLGGLDGTSTVAELLADAGSAARGPIMATLRLLYVDGALAL